MLRIFSYFVVSVFYFLFYCNGHKTGLKSDKYEVVLRDARSCVAPQPPFLRKCLICPQFEVYTSQGRTYLRGNTTIKAPLALRNFNARSFIMNSAGERKLQAQIIGVSCRNFMVSAIFKFTNISFVRHNCSLLKGFYTYFIDLNKITHSLPVWHEPGHMVHQFQIVAGGATALCSEVDVEIKSVG